MPANAIQNKEDIERIKQYFIEQNNFVYDRHLLYFVLGINTCLKPRDLASLKWSDILISGDIIKDYIEYNGYKFYLNLSCKNAINNHIEKYNDVINDIYVFTGIGHKQNHIRYESMNKMYRILEKELRLNFEFSNLTLHKTFVYWQIYYCHRDYVKMSKLRLITKESIQAKERDINVYADYNINDDMIYINDVNL